MNLLDRILCDFHSAIPGHPSFPAVSLALLLSGLPWSRMFDEETKAAAPVPRHTSDHHQRFQSVRRCSRAVLPMGGCFFLLPRRDYSEFHDLPLILLLHEDFLRQGEGRGDAPRMLDHSALFLGTRAVLLHEGADKLDRHPCGVTRGQCTMYAAGLLRFARCVAHVVRGRPVLWEPGSSVAG